MDGSETLRPAIIGVVYVGKARAREVVASVFTKRTAAGEPQDVGRGFAYAGYAVTGRHIIVSANDADRRGGGVVRALFGLLGGAVGRLLRKLTRRVASRPIAKRARLPGKAAPRRDSAPAADDESARKEKILTVAGKLFSQRGYASVAIREIADAAGILGGSLYYYFPSKRDLFIEVHRRALTRAVTGIEAAIAGKSDPWERFEAAIMAHMTIYLDPTSLTQPLMSDSSAMMSDMRGELIKDRDSFERIYRRLVDELPLPSRINRTVYRLFVLSQLNSVANWYRPGKLSPRQIGQQIFWLVSF